VNTLPIVGQEYDYLGQPVTVLRIVPLEGGTEAEAYVEFQTRFSEYGECTVSRLRERTSK